MRPVFILDIILLLVGCERRDERVPMMDEQGSFTVGGTILTDSLGRTFHDGHTCVFYQKPAGTRKYPLAFAHGVGQFSRTREAIPDGHGGFQNIFLRRRFSVYFVDQPHRGNAGGSTESVTISPAFDKRVRSNRFHIGIWPGYSEGVQFKRGKKTLGQYFRQMTPTIDTTDFEVYSDIYAALFGEIGPGVFIIHSQGRSVEWNTLLKTRNIKAIASYEPGGAVPSPEGRLPGEAKFITLSKKMKDVEVPMSISMEYTKVPIVIYYGGNLPGTDERPELYGWARHLRLMKIWAKMLNDQGGDITIIHLPEVGLHGNTHFPISDLNNIEIADLLSEWLHTKALD